MSSKSILFAIMSLIFLLVFSHFTLAQDDANIAPPAGEDDDSYSETEPANSYRTTQTIGNAPAWTNIAGTTRISVGRIRLLLAVKSSSGRR